MNYEVRLLFHELAELSPGEREQFFRERQIGAELRAEVESLLSFDSTDHQHLTDRVSHAAELLLNSASASRARSLRTISPGSNPRLRWHGRRLSGRANRWRNSTAGGRQAPGRSRPSPRMARPFSQRTPAPGISPSPFDCPRDRRRAYRRRPAVSGHGICGRRSD